MNLNINAQNLLLGHCAKTFHFANLCSDELCILCNPNGAPHGHMRSELLGLMLQPCHDTGVIVGGACKPWNGQVSGRQVSGQEFGRWDHVLQLPSTSTESYWKGVAQAMGIPAEVPKKDSAWKPLGGSSCSGKTSGSGTRNRRRLGLIAFCVAFYLHVVVVHHLKMMS